MAKTDELLREFAYKYAEPKVIWNDGDVSICPDEEKIESFVSELRKLIAQVEEERIEDELKSYLEYNGADESDREILIKSYIKSGWFRNRMKHNQ